MNREQNDLFLKLGIQDQHLKSYKLNPSPEAKMIDLVVADVDFEGKAFLLDFEAAIAWKAMVLAALKEDIQLKPFSGFRSVKYQELLIQKRLENGRSIDDILKHIAIPGYSEHHTGCAVDIYSKDNAVLEESFEQTAEFNWLLKNATRFGFSLSYPRDNQKGIIFEPWHWFYNKSNEVHFKINLESDWLSLVAGFVRKLVSEMQSFGITFMSDWKIDHVCYRVETEDQYQHFKKYFLTLGRLLIESDVNGRLISTFKLHSPIRVYEFLIDLIELPAPKKSKPQKEGFEHFEIVCRESFEEIQKSFRHLKFDDSGAKKSINPELELKLKSGSIKFHHQSLEQVIADELKTFA